MLSFWPAAARGPGLGPCKPPRSPKSRANSSPDLPKARKFRGQGAFLNLIQEGSLNHNLNPYIVEERFLDSGLLEDLGSRRPEDKDRT